MGASFLAFLSFLRRTEYFLGRPLLKRLLILLGVTSQNVASAANFKDLAGKSWIKSAWLRSSKASSSIPRYL